MNSIQFRWLTERQMKIWVQRDHANRGMHSLKIEWKSRSTNSHSKMKTISIDSHGFQPQNNVTSSFGFHSSLCVCVCVFVACRHPVYVYVLYFGIKINNYQQTSIDTIQFTRYQRMNEWMKEINRKEKLSNRFVFSRNKSEKYVFFLLIFEIRSFVP